MNQRNLLGARSFMLAALLLSMFFAPVNAAENWWKDNLKSTQWTATWATAVSFQSPFDPPAATINDTTLRQIVRISEGGSKVRVTLTNEFGTAPLNVGAAHIALRDMGWTIVSGSGQALTFGGSTSVVIAPGGRVLSDPVDLDLLPLSDLAISIYMPDDLSASASPATYHIRALQTNYLGSGNQTGDTDFVVSESSTAWHFLASVDVAHHFDRAVIATFGDSITDGDQNGAPNEPVDLNQRYSNYLAEAIIAGGKQAAVINLGISGNQVTNTFIGENPLARLDRDVLTQTGVTHVVFAEGINDIGLPVLLNIIGIPYGEVSAASIIAGYQQVIARAKGYGLTVVGGTLSPSGGSALPGYSGEVTEAKRQEVNAWIRNSGAYDAVVDFDALLSDPADPTIMQAALTADGLHPNAAGYKIMADAVFAAVASGLPPRRFEGVR